MIQFHPYTRSVEVVLLFSVYRRGNQDSRRLNSWLKNTQLGSDRDRLWLFGCLPLNQCLLAPSLHHQGKGYPFPKRLWWGFCSTCSGLMPMPNSSILTREILAGSGGKGQLHWTGSRRDSWKDGLQSTTELRGCPSSTACSNWGGLWVATASLTSMLLGTWTFKSPLQPQWPHIDPLKSHRSRTSQNYSHWVLDLSHNGICTCVGSGAEVGSLHMGPLRLWLCTRCSPLWLCHQIPQESLLLDVMHSYKPCLRVGHFKKELQVLCWIAQGKEKKLTHGQAVRKWSQVSIRQSPTNNAISVSPRASKWVERMNPERNLLGAKCFPSEKGLEFRMVNRKSPPTPTNEDTFLRTQHQRPRLIIDFEAYFSWY